MVAVVDGLVWNRVGERRFLLCLPKSSSNFTVYASFKSANTYSGAGFHLNRVLLDKLLVANALFASGFSSLFIY